jgi:predicted transposase YbfD/YdcC
VRVAPLSFGELDFPGARSIALVTRHIEDKKTGKISEETVPHISNLLNPTAEQFGCIVRRHWAIESLFHVRDATMHEDRQTMHTGSGAMNFALLRSIAIGVSSVTKARSLPDSAWRFRKAAYSFLAHFQVDPLALAA